MIDRERGIAGLERCVAFHVDCTATDCPYHGVECCTELMRDALALLKAQEPHIVTISDYVDNPDVDKDGNLPVWRESRHFPGVAYHSDGWVLLNRNRVEGWFNSEVIRFWTSRPTDAQRQAVKWDG